MMVPHEILARRLRALTGARKIRTTHLAEATGINRQSLTTKLDNTVQFTYDELRRVIEVLGVDWQELLSADEEETMGGAIREK